MKREKHEIGGASKGEAEEEEDQKKEDDDEQNDEDEDENGSGGETSESSDDGESGRAVPKKRPLAKVSRFLSSMNCC